MSVEIGSKIGPYEVLSSVGAGGMGEVYRARDTRLDREVAIKVLPRRMAQDADAHARFEREAQAVAALTHPNILSIFDVGFVDDSPYYVTELLEGETLRQRLASEPKLGWQKAVEIGIQLAEGLAAAHNKKIVHRDLKPENIFLTQDGRVKILDFGLARVDRPLDKEHSSAPTAISHTEPGTVLGTVGYMSPEQVRGQPADERSDIFSAGCVLYEMVTGSRAFQGETASDIMAAILRDEVRNASDSGVAVPFQLEWIIETCLKKDPQDRFQSARDLRAELRSVQGSGESLYFRTPQPAQPQPKRPSRLGILAATALLLAVVAAVSWVFFAAHDSPPPPGQEEPPPIRSLAVLPFDIGTADPHVEYLSDEVAEGIINRLSGRDDLLVMAWSTVEKYKESGIDPMAAGRELGVDAVLTGRVSVRDEMVSVQTSLVDSRRGFQVWGERFEHPYLKAAEFQELVAQQVADRLGIDLPSAGFEMAQWKVDDPQAFNFYLEGRNFERKQKEIERDTRQLEKQEQPPRTEAADKGAAAEAEAQQTAQEMDRKAEIWQAQIESFQKALAIDKDFVMAQKSLAESLAEAGISGIVAPQDIMPRAKEAASRLMQMDKSSEAAYLILGTVHSRFERDWKNAGESLRLAVEMKPDSAEIRHRYAMDYLAPTGRLDEALEQMRRAAQLKPKDPTLQAELGRVLYYARRYDEAIDLLDDVADEMPGARAYYYLALANLKAGNLESGAEVLKDLLEDADDGDVHLMRPERRQAMALLGLAYGMAGQADQARRILGRLQRAVQGREMFAGHVAPPPHPGAPAPPRPPSAPPSPGAASDGKETRFGSRPPRRAEFVQSLTFYQQSSWPYWLAHAHLGLGEHEEALNLLRQAVESRVGEAIYLKADPIFDPLRSNPRFQELIQMLNLE